MYPRYRSWLIVLLLVAIVVLGGSACARPAASTTKPALPEPVDPVPSPTDIGGFKQPTNIVAPDDGSGRLFVTERQGVIRVARGGQLIKTPALDITSQVGSEGSEDGLLGFAFPPGFAKKGYAYVYFTDTSKTPKLYRVRVSADNPDAFDASTMQLIMEVKEPATGNRGGQLAFGPDGYLYVGVGDGETSTSPTKGAQDPSTMLGKILRIDTESTPTQKGYRVPEGNAFAGRSGAQLETWAYGLRDPWRFSFDPLTGDLWIGDLGQEQWEEVDHVVAGSKSGLNFGWPLYEGEDVALAPMVEPGFAWPVFAYTHREGRGVTGGYVYHGAKYPGMQGLYVFGDRDSGNIWTIQRKGTKFAERLARETLYKISTFGLDGDGELWLADYATGRIHQVDDLSR